MSTADNPTPGGPTWADTQHWLADLDRDTQTTHRPRRDPARHQQSNTTELDIDDVRAQSAAVRLDDPAAVLGADEPGAAEPPPPPPVDVDTSHITAPTGAPRFNKAVAAGFAAATALATVALTATLLGMHSSPHTTREEASTTTHISFVTAPSTTPADPDRDAPIPYTASASCPPGSTAAQSVAGTDPTRAWVCVRGGVDGQVLTLDLGRTMVVTAVSLTPGWLGADTSGTEQWLAHRVLARVQWIFNDTPPTVLTQHTGNVHGEAVQPIPNRGVLASTITMVVLETARAPADAATTPSAAPPAPGALFGEPLTPPAPPPAPTRTDLPALPGAQAPADPADNTFAVSSIKVLGHPPA